MIISIYDGLAVSVNKPRVLVAYTAKEDWSTPVTFARQRFVL